MAKALRWAILLMPSVLSFVATFTLARRFPPHEMEIGRIPWWIGLFSIGVAVLILSEKLTRRLLPLATLFQLSLVFPDAAPSRFSLAMKTNSTRKLERRLIEIRDNGLPDDTAQHAELMLELVAALSLHDRLTRGHCERVRAYTDMISEEMKLPEADAAKLRWAALLHDVGKIYVPSEVLNKVGRPTEDEWDALKSHTWKGDELIEPLREFLGPWANAVRNHHERWDGNGYPDRLAGSEIPLGGRIVAVADAFDVMTSTRSYKEPRPASEARKEIARCAGGQFDPEVARAFLNIGLGRLRFAVGPLSWLANISAVSNAPAFVGTAASQTVGTFVATAAATAVALGAFPADAPAEIAFEAPPVTIAAPETTETPTTDQSPPERGPQTPVAQQSVVTLAEDSVSPVVLASNAGDLETIFVLIKGPENGTLSLPDSASNFTYLTAGTGRAPAMPSLAAGAELESRFKAADQAANMTAVYTPDPDFNGSDDFRYRACNSAARSFCSDAVISLRVTPVNDSPQAGDNSITIPEDSTLILTPGLVLANDTDVDGDSLTVSWLNPALGTTTVKSNVLNYRPPTNSTRPFKIRYRACDAEVCDDAFVSVDIQPIDDAPIAVNDFLSTLEDTPLTVTTDAVTANDSEVDGDRTVLNWIAHPQFNPGTTTFTPLLNSTDPVELTYQLCDVSGGLCDQAKVTVEITPQPDTPIAVGEQFAKLEDSLFGVQLTDLLANDSDPDGENLQIVWGKPSPKGGSLSSNLTEASYRPPLDFVGTVRIPYQACAAERCSPSVNLILDFTPVNDAPRPPPVTTLAGTENVATSVSFAQILDAATDVDDIRSNLRLKFPAPRPTGFAFTPDPANPTGFRFRPTRHDTTTIEILYQVCDDDNACGDAVLRLTFVERDDPPEPLPLTTTVDEDQNLTMDTDAFLALVNDSDSPIEELTFSFTQTNPSLGAPNYDPATKQFTYGTTLNASGQTEITYTACDRTTTTNCPSNKITLTVEPVNDLPTVEATTVLVQNPEDTVVVVADAEMLALVADVDNQTSDLSFSFVDPGSGSFTQNNQGFTYIPEPNFVGQIVIDYRVCDFGGCSIDIGQVTLEFSTLDDAPQPVDIVAPAVDEDPPSPIVITRADLVAAANDVDTPDAGLTFSAGTPSADIGELLQQPNGDWHFTPYANANGPTTFGFQVCDSNIDPGPNCEPFDVTFEVNPINDRPVISVLQTTFTGSEDVDTLVTAGMLSSLNLFSDVDAAFDELTLLISDPGGGLTVNPDGQSFTYRPAPDSTADVILTYTVCDPEGLCSLDTGEMALTFGAVDDPPEAGDMVLGPFAEDAASTIIIDRATLEANTTDKDSALSIITYEVTISSGDDLGSWSDPGDGSLELIVPDDAYGTAIFGVNVCDATSCGRFGIRVDIDAVNDPPVTIQDPSAVSTRFSPPEAVVLPVDYRVTDADPDDVHTVVPYALDPAFGTITYDSIADTWTFSPNPAFAGTQVVVPFQICDPAGSCADSQWIIDVIANSPPAFGAVGLPQLFVNIAMTDVNFTVTDAEGDPLTLTNSTLPQGLVLAGSNGNYTISGTPTDPNDLGQTVNFSIEASDGLNTSVHNGSFEFSDQGLSPDAGKVILSEVASDDVRVCMGFFCQEEVEAVEVTNISSGAMFIGDWTLQDHTPGAAPDANGLTLQLSDNMIFLFPMWPTTLTQGDYAMLSTFWKANPTPYNFNGDDLWLLDENGLIVDYVGWQDAWSPQIPIPAPELGIWDSNRAAMVEIGGKPISNTKVSISLATLSNADTAACWEFTSSGFAGNGTYVCPAADTTPTIDHPDAQGNYGLRDKWVHSLEYPNWQ